MSEQKGIEEKLMKKKLKAQSVYLAKPRSFIYHKIKLKQFQNILDVGCGNGFVVKEMRKKCDRAAKITGIDISPGMIESARKTLAGAQGVELIVGDALALPFPDGTFDLAICNLLLLWVKEPENAIREMARVTKPGGKIVAMYEPDNAGKCNYPEDKHLSQVVEFMKRKGADPFAGRKLRMFFAKAGVDAEIGIHPYMMSAEMMKIAHKMDREYNVKILKGMGIPEKEVEEWLAINDEMIENGHGLWFLPAFYGIGVKE
jgi:ubiquinone/menaquinone biosynthesis C-methylase UbiE